MKFGEQELNFHVFKASALCGWLSGIYSQPFGYQPKTVWDCISKMDGVKMTIFDDDELWQSPGDLISNSGSYSVILKIL